MNKQIEELRQQLSAAQNSDQHNFERWQAAQADNERLFKALIATNSDIDSVNDAIAAHKAHQRKEES